ncbi:MAG: transketolase family protein [Tyzzerella sp.]|nr:transketolase family protein [Tyzzerella sp.]
MLNKGKETVSYLRNVMGAYMTELGKRDEKVVVVNADLSGTCRNTDFCKAYPERAFNTGIAEQNMISFAAGLAHEGFIPYTFSMAPFLTMRACEQCRTDVAYANLSVRLMGVYAGVSGGISGATHWALEDCGIMCAIPGMVVLEPSDAVQAKKMLDATLQYNGPIYIRSSVEPVKDIYDENCQFEVGSSTVLREGNDGTFLCSGVIVQYALEAAEIIRKQVGAEIRVVDMYSIKPIDENAIVSACMTGNIIVAQDHNIIGGLGSMVATVIAETGNGVKFRILGINDKFEAMAHANYLYRLNGIDTNGLVQSMLNMLRSN